MRNLRATDSPPTSCTRLRVVRTKAAEQLAGAVGVAPPPTQVTTINDEDDEDVPM